MINYLVAFLALTSHLIGYNNFLNIVILFIILFLYFFQTRKQLSLGLPNSLLLIFLSAISLLGIVSTSLAITLSAAIILWREKSLKAVLIIILILELPLISSIEGVLFNKLAFANGGFLGPLIVIASLFGLFFNSYRYISKCLLTIFFTFLGSRYFVPFTSFYDLFLLLPLIYLFVSAFKISKFEKINAYNSTHFKSIVAILIFFAGLHSLSFFPNFSNNYYYYLPDIKNSYESKFFLNYDDALSYSGKKFTKIQSLSEVPEGSIVLYPWLTEDDPGINSKTIRDTALAKKLTLVLVGEHTNYSHNANIINSITNRLALNSDLTVPEFNTDESGHLRSSDFIEWPANSILNRGASVNLNILDLQLLSGDNWWIEKDIGEWLWVGDYIREIDDRFGRVSLGAAFREGNTRFIVFGDTSPFMNFHLIANPTAFNRLLDLATCKGIFLKSFLLLVTVFIYLRYSKVKIPFFILLIIIFSTCYLFSYKNSVKWDYFNVGQSGFNYNNFNKKLAEFNDLTKLNLRRSRYLNPSSIFKDEDSIHFGLIDRELILKDFTVSHCRRMGLVDTSEFTLMDGQSCQVLGNAELLGGTNKSAPAIKFNYHGYTKILIFDVGFLSEQAPEKNVFWILNHFKK
jgi:hypothetical protein